MGSSVSYMTGSVLTEEQYRTLGLPDGESAVITLTDDKTNSYDFKNVVIDENTNEIHYRNAP